jgi:hypothetical protein
MEKADRKTVRPESLPVAVQNSGKYTQSVFLNYRQ